MKKIFLFIAILIIIFLGLVIAVPVFFKQKLFEATRSALENKLDAIVEIEKFKLSVFRDFPNATLELNGLYIIGEESFADDTLMMTDKLYATTNLLSIIKSSPFTISKVEADNLTVNMRMNGEGEANWDIVKTSGIQGDYKDKTDPRRPGRFAFQLDNFEIRNGTFLYMDESSGMMMKFSGIDIDIYGGMYGNVSTLQTKGKSEKFTVNYGGINYLQNQFLAMEAKIQVDFQTMEVKVLENELLLNRLPLNFTGSVRMPQDSIIMNLEYKTTHSGFENFLALLPPTFNSNVKDLTLGGIATVTGRINGYYNDNSFPAFLMKLKLDNGNVQYLSRREQMKNINAEMVVKKAQGEMDLATVTIANAHLELENNPVDFSGSLKNLFTDPRFAGAVKGRINMEHLSNFIPSDSIRMRGFLDANLEMNGSYSSIKNQHYRELKSDGSVSLENFIFNSPSLTREVKIPSGRLEFSPESIDLEKLSLLIGKSDLLLTGKVSGYLDYLFNDGILSGSLVMNSQHIDFNEVLLIRARDHEAVGKREKVGAESSKDTLRAISVPENIDITFRSSINQGYFNRVQLHEIQGLIIARKGVLFLNDLRMGLMEGELAMNGSYRNTKDGYPWVDFGFEIMELDIPVAYRSLTGMQRMFPVAGHSKGKFTSSLNINGRLNEFMKFVPSTINGKGELQTKDLQIENSPMFNELKGILRVDLLRNVTVEDFAADFSIENGNMVLRPFQTTIAGQETRVKGSLSADHLLDLRMDFNVEREAFGADIQNILSVIPGNNNIDFVPAGVLIKGPVGDPEIKMDLSETRKTITDATKDDLKKSLNRLGKGLKKLFEK